VVVDREQRAHYVIKSCILLPTKMNRIGSEEVSAVSWRQVEWAIIKQVKRRKQ